MNRSIRGSDASQAFQSPSVDKKLSDSVKVNQNKLSQFIVNSPAVKQKDPDAVPIMTFQKQTIDEHGSQTEDNYI